MVSKVAFLSLFRNHYLFAVKHFGQYIRECHGINDIDNYAYAYVDLVLFPQKGESLFSALWLQVFFQYYPMLFYFLKESLNSIFRPSKVNFLTFQGQDADLRRSTS